MNPVATAEMMVMMSCTYVIFSKSAPSILLHSLPPCIQKERVGFCFPIRSWICDCGIPLFSAAVIVGREIEVESDDVENFPFLVFDAEHSIVAALESENPNVLVFWKIP